MQRGQKNILPFPTYTLSFLPVPHSALFLPFPFHLLSLPLYPSVPSARAPLSLHSHRLRLQVTGCRHGARIIGAFIETMTEGLSVHYNHLEDPITGFSKSGKEDVVNGHPHTDAITVQALIHAQIQQSLTEIRQTLARIERQHNVQHPSPSEHSPPLPFSPSITAPFPHLRSPLAEISYFSGKNIISWLFHIEQFWKHRTPPEQKLVIAAVYLSGEALQWYTWMRATRQISTWEFFSRDLEQKFGPTSSLNHKAPLSHLRQTSIASAYMADVAPPSIRTSGQLIAQKIRAESDSRSTTVAAFAIVWVLVIESDGSSSSPDQSETSDEVLRVV